MIRRLPSTYNAERLSWDDYFQAIAETVALRSTCPRLHVGCVIVRDNRIVSTGYNGSPPRAAHCTEVGCLMVDGHCMRTIHAEENAVLQAIPKGVDLAECTIYCTYKPCSRCTALLRDNGIFRMRFPRVL